MIKGANSERILMSLLEQCGTLSIIFPVETHWHGGMVERHRSTAKTIARKLIDTYKVLTTRIFDECCRKPPWPKTACQDSGFSTNKWLFGYDNPLPGSVLDCPNDIPIHDHVQAGGPLARKVNMRETARTTWLQLGNSNLIRRALWKNPDNKGKVLFLVRRFSPIICSMRVDPIRVGPITPNHGMALRLCFPTGFGYFAD
jgi:hypothetical protein